MVAQGTFFPGDRVQFARIAAPFWASEGDVADGEDIIASLFVTDISRLSPAFDLVATTPRAFSALRLTRVDSQPTLIPVTWTQRLAADTLPVAVATLLGLLLTCMNLIAAYVTNAAGKPGKRRGPDGSAG